MKTTIKIQTIKTKDSVLFGFEGTAYTGASYADGEVITPISGEVVNDYEVKVAYDGRSYKGNLGKDIAAGLNDLYSSNYTTHEVDIIGGNLPEMYPLEHPNKTGEFRAKQQTEWEKCLGYFKHNLESW